MPKGSKTCSHCGRITGPRAFVCPTCAKPFVIKGVLADITSPAFKPSKAIEEELIKVSDFMEEIDYSKDPTNLRCFDGNARVWETKDGKYRLRYAETFMGIKVGHENPYTLLRSNTDPRVQIEWDFIHRFKNMQKALRGFRKVLAGESPVEKKAKRKAGKPVKKKKLIEKLTENLA